MVTKWIMIGALAAAGLTGPAIAQPQGPLEPRIDGVIDLPMYRDPDVRVGHAETVFDPRLQSLWSQALGRPEADLRWQAATAFGQAAEQGMTGLESVVSLLTARLLEDEVPEVRVAAAQALARIDNPSAAAAMLKANQAAVADSEMILLTDPALARWKHAPAFPVWQERVTAGRPVVVASSAARSLGTAQAIEARDVLLAAATGAAHPAVRLAAAEALQEMEAPAPDDGAAELAEGGPVDRIVAAYLLAGEPAAAPDRLAMLAQGDEPVAAAIAAEALAGIDAPRVIALGAALADHAEPGVRRAAVRAAASQPIEPAVALLIGRLDDPSTAVRSAAREALVAFGSETPVSDAVRTHLTQVLASESSGWRAREQAALALGILDHEPAADLLIEQLQNPRPEASLAAATALRQLSMRETLPAVFERVQELTNVLPELVANASNNDGKAEEVSGTSAENELVAGTTRIESIGADATQLIMLLGDLAYEPANEVLRRYIPLSSPYAIEARAAAVWTLGKIYEGRPQPDLAKRFAQRMADIMGMQPEADNVRQMSAVSIGRMNDDSKMDTLERFAAAERSSPVGRAALWAIAQIRNQPLELDGPGQSKSTGWFLEPLSR